MTTDKDTKKQQGDAEFEYDKAAEAAAGDDMLDDSVVAEESAGETIKKLREKLKKAQAEAQEHLTGWQRAKADFVNAKKRSDEELKEYRKFANEGLIEELLPVLESFQMAMGNKEAWEKADKNWRMGVEYIYSQLLGVLKGAGLEEIDPSGKDFDPLRDEAVSNEPVADKAQHGKVLRVIQRGYTLSGKPMRAPKVVVGEWKEA
jgi:molecular chaperone GrpE